MNQDRDWDQGLQPLRSDRSSVWPVAHVIRQPVQLLAKVLAQSRRHVLALERAIHAPQPFVALSRPDGERQMSGAQARMAVFLHVGLRTAGPVAQIQMQLVAGRAEARRVQLANRRGFGRAVDEIVESVDEPANAGIAAHLLEGSRRSITPKFIPVSA